jgi:hypothetical protein
MIPFRHFLLKKKSFRPPRYEEFLEINFQFVVCLYEFYTPNVKSVDSLMVRTPDYINEGPGLNTRDRQGFFTSFFPLLQIDIPFSCNNQE